MTSVATAPDDQLTPGEAHLEAARINVLLGNFGLSPSHVTYWWSECAYSELDKMTPLTAWQRGEYTRVKELVETLISGQFSKQLADNPTVLKRTADLGR